MSKPSWQQTAKAQAHEACAVEIDMAVAPHRELVALWGEWCEWRTEVCQLDKLKPWSPRAARAEMRNLAIAVSRHSTDEIAQQMRNAIAGCWIGLNLDKMRISQSAAKSSSDPYGGWTPPTGV